MRATLALPQRLADELAAWTELTDETAGVIIARPVTDGGEITLLGCHVHTAPHDAYLRRSSHGIGLRSTGWVPAVRAAARDGLVAVFVHSHPGGTPEPSNADVEVDHALVDPFRRLTGQPIYSSLIVGVHGRLAGRLYRDDAGPLPLRIRVVGDALTIHDPAAPGAGIGVHDRQIRAFGAAGQHILRGLHVGVVGAGGTGSPVAEQLTRLGVGTITIIDDDIVTAPTVARGYGTTTGDIGRAKVDVAADHLRRIGLATTVNPIAANLRNQDAARALAHADVVFCCVDGHSARLILNRWASWHLAPVIDTGVLIDSRHGRINDITARLTWIAPGAACLLCRQRIDPQAARLESLDPDERRALAVQGYAPELAEPDPSVITYTSLAAALATSELLNRLFGLADLTPTEQLLRVRDRTVSANRRSGRAGCFCTDPDSWGQGLTDPYLDLTWTD